MTRSAFLLLILLALPSVVRAQPVTVTPGTSHVGWDEPGQTLPIATGSTYNAYVDALPPVVVAGVTCTANAAGLVTCVGNWPAMTPGAHTVTVTQVNGGESLKSSGLSITFSVTVTPTNVRQVP